jgi:hypothetical protein
MYLSTMVTRVPGGGIDLIYPPVSVTCQFQNLATKNRSAFLEAKKSKARKPWRHLRIDDDDWVDRDRQPWVACMLNPIPYDVVKPIRGISSG